MGGEGVFRKSLKRKPLARWNVYERASGPHNGVQPANLPMEVYIAVSDGDSVDVHLYKDLQTTISLDGLYDILEMKEVHESWKHAELLNRDQGPKT